MNSKVTLTIFDNKMIPVTKTYTDLKIVNNRELKIDFQVPSNLISVSLKFEADVKNISKQTDDHLQANYDVQIETYQKSIQFYETYLRRIRGEYFIYVLGKNGEPLEDTNVTLQFTHAILGQKEGIQKKTDEDGRINLGQLQNIILINAKIQGIHGNFVHNWAPQAHSELCSYPVIINILEGESVDIPVHY